MTRVLVTGGSGFIGAALTVSLVHRGFEVRVFDNNSRGNLRRLQPVMSDVDFVQGDIRDAEAVDAATKGMDWVFHLAFVNGTEFFYKTPDLVLDVGVRGALTTMDAAKKHGVERYIAASSSEIYQQPTHVPTSENERAIIPDVTNPRFSYSGGKLVTELLTLHYLRPSEIHRIIFRPHNVYGPDMGWEHVIPQFMRRLTAIEPGTPGEIPFPIQGTGEETRAFCYVSDAVDGILLCAAHGENGGIFHVGVDEEVSIADLVRRVGRLGGVSLQPRPQALLAGSTSRRCPDIARLRALGYRPRVDLTDGLQRTWEWYREAAAQLAPT